MCLVFVAHYCIFTLVLSGPGMSTIRTLRLALLCPTKLEVRVSLQHRLGDERADLSIASAITDETELRVVVYDVDEAKLAEDDLMGAATVCPPFCSRFRSNADHVGPAVLLSVLVGGAGSLWHQGGCPYQ